MDDAAFAEAVYEDSLQREQVEDHWTVKYGALGMHQNAGGPTYALAVRNSDFFLPLALWEKAAALWYAPARGDTVDITVGLNNPGGGKTTIIVASNYAMTNYLGIMFDSTPSTDVVRTVTGTGPIVTVNQGSSANLTIPTNGNMYLIRYTLSTNKLQLFYTDSLVTPIIEWTDSSDLVVHGPGHRYVGVSWQASFLSSGPRLYYWKVDYS